MATHRERLALRLVERAKATVLSPEECDRLMAEHEAEKAREAAVREDDGDAAR